MTYDRLTLCTITGAALSVAIASFQLLEAEYAVVSCLLGWTMLTIAISDATRYIVPDVLSLPSIPIGLLATHLLDGSDRSPPLVLEHLGAALLGTALLYGLRAAYFYYRNREGLGCGDVKLAAVAGAWTGIPGVSNVLLLACMAAITWVVLISLWQRRALTKETALPFGVFLAPATWVIWCSAAISGAP
jgi:leader peptidase (prepilin peptidase)/N-methyltransferase